MRPPPCRLGTHLPLRRTGSGGGSPAKRDGRTLTAGDETRTRGIIRKSLFHCAASRKKWGQNGDNVSGAHTLGYQWHQLEEGSRVREHPTRKHGSKPDLYFAIRCQKDGKRQGESLDWTSQGMTLHKARLALAQLREAARTGNGATRLREQRQKGACALLPEQ